MIAAIAVILVGAGTYTEAYCNPLILKNAVWVSLLRTHTAFVFFYRKTACENFMQIFIQGLQYRITDVQILPSQGRHR